MQRLAEQKVDASGMDTYTQEMSKVRCDTFNFQLRCSPLKPLAHPSPPVSTPYSSPLLPFPSTACLSITSHSPCLHTLLPSLVCNTATTAVAYTFGCHLCSALRSGLRTRAASFLACLVILMYSVPRSPTFCTNEVRSTAQLFYYRLVANKTHSQLNSCLHIMLPI